MLSKRQFFTISLVMAAVFFMFQFTGVLKDKWNVYGTNEYDEVSDTDLGISSLIDIPEVDIYTDGSYVLYIGSAEDDMCTVSSQWCSYTQRYFTQMSSINQLISSEAIYPEMLLLNPDYVDFEGDLDAIAEIASAGTSVVFMKLPDVSVIKGNEELMSLLGISEIRQDVVEAYAIELFEDFLLGGANIFEATDEDSEKDQDLELSVPWYITRTGTKVYMMAMIEESLYSDEDIEYEYYPSVMWRRSLGSGYIFAIGADFMEDTTALGILSAMVYDINDYSLYPVVNAQNLVIANFASLSSEYDEELEAEYYQTQIAFFRDLVWPNIVSVWTVSNDLPTVIFNPRLDYDASNSLDDDDLVYYMKLLKEQSGEAARSSFQSSTVDLLTKLNEDLLAVSSAIPDYVYRVLYVTSDDVEAYQEIEAEEALPDVKTVLYDIDHTATIFGYDSEDITYQRATSDGFTHTYSDNIRLRSLETALGYSTILVDMSVLLEPEEADSTWERLSERFASYTVSYWKAFSTFEKTVLSQSDQRIRRYLALSYEDEFEDNVITLSIDGFDEEAFFLLRTHGKEIEDIEGATYEEVEEGAYLLTITETTVTITLEKDEATTVIY